MTGGEAFFLLFAVLGGLALFIYGMNVMTEGLRGLAGNRLRRILARASSNRFAGLGLGLLLGFLIHSSATTVMLVGFIHAGLMTLAQAIPAMLGCNIGTTISMQVISFKIDEYCFFAVTLGFMLHIAPVNRRWRNIGSALFGFGLLFLGMKTMSGAIKPHHHVLAPVLERIDGTRWSGLLLGILVSTAITGVIQSSGATIGMCYALITAGAFTELKQVYPIVLGAHIGTCATALLGSIGTNVQARRLAVSHLVFNIFNVTLAVFAAPFFLYIIPLTSTDLVHQTANLHTLVIATAVLVMIPFCAAYARFISLLLRSDKPLPETGHLDEALLATPEKALTAMLLEMRRAMRLCTESFEIGADLLVRPEPRTRHRITLNEQAVDDVKTAMRVFVLQLTQRYLSHRQAILMLHIDRCMSSIERISDHIDRLADVTMAHAHDPRTSFDQDLYDRLFAITMDVNELLKRVTASLDPEHREFQELAREVLHTRDAVVVKLVDAQVYITRELTHCGRGIAPATGMYFNEIVSGLGRIVKHCRAIALAESRPHFWIKRKKLDKIADNAPDYGPPADVDIQDYLDELHEQDYL